MSDEDWDSGFGKSVAVYLNGLGIPELDARGQRVTDSSFFLCFNAHHEPIEFALPPAEFGQAWMPVVDTSTATPNSEDQEPIQVGSAVRVGPRTMVVLEAEQSPASGRCPQ
jgi:glycogen operon protein